MDALQTCSDGDTQLAQHHTPWAVERPHNGMRYPPAQALTAGGSLGYSPGASRICGRELGGGDGHDDSDGGKDKETARCVGRSRVEGRTGHGGVARRVGVLPEVVRGWRADTSRECEGRRGNELPDSQARSRRFGSVSGAVLVGAGEG